MLKIRSSLPISCAVALLGACNGGSSLESSETSDMATGTSDMATATTDMTTGSTADVPTTTDMVATTTDMTTGPSTTDTTGDGDPPVEPMGTSLFVQVLDMKGDPIPIAAVTLDGVTRATNGAGQILFEQLTPGRFSARVEAYGYAAASAVTELAEGAHGGLELRLLPIGKPIPFSADEGGILEHGGVRVTIPSQALVDPNGEPVTGMVEATIVPLDPTSDIRMSPGPLAGLPTNGDGEVGLESVFMAEVSLWQDGNRLQLKPGAKATLEMVLPESLQGQYIDGDVVPAWWFDLDAGIWKEDGAGTIGPSQVQPGKLAWTAEVGHFTWWNCDQPWTDKNCFDVHLVDTDGDPLVNSTVHAQGVSYLGLSGGAVAGPDGHACVDIKLNSTVDLLIGDLYMPAVIQQVTSMGPASTCAGMGAACETVVIMVPDGAACVPGASMDCTSVPPDTLYVGVCQADTNYCNAQGTEWIGCSGEIQPTPENCNTPFDEDCDGLVNEEGNGCNCIPGEYADCYTGPAGTIDVGLCEGGQRQCNPDGVGYGPCVGQVVPAADLCDTPEDDDCNGDLICVDDPPLWEKPMGGTAKGMTYDVAADDHGNIIATGNFTQILDLGAGPMFGVDDVFLAKFDTAGNTLWSKKFGDEYYQGGYAVSVDGAGNIILGGYFTGTLDLGGAPLVAVASDVFVAKFDPDGNHLWSKSFARSVLNEVAVDPSGNVVVTGTFEVPTSFGGNVLMSAGGRDLFLVELDAAGNHLWSRSFGNSNQQDYPHVVVDASETVVLVGNLIGTIDFGGGPRIAESNQNVFMARFDGNGAHVSSESFAGMGQSVTGLTLDPQGNIAISVLAGSIDFGGGMLGPGAMVAGLTPSGTHLWSTVHPLVLANSIAVDGAGDIASFHMNKLAKVDINGGLIWNKTISTDPELEFMRVVFDGDDSPIVAGRIGLRPFIAKLAP